MVPLLVSKRYAMPELLKSRLAPTPSGYLHIGNLASFVLTWLITKKQQGHLLLRIDDLDNERRRNEYIGHVFQTLQQFGITYNEGPTDTIDFLSQWSQHHRLHSYHHLLHQLVQSGEVYACHCSRKQQLISACTCKTTHLALHTPGCCWKIEVPADTTIEWMDQCMGKTSIALYQHMKSIVVRRSNGMPAYHIASLADDLHFGMNLLVRGSDLLPSTAAQWYLAELAGISKFGECQFLHHPLMHNEAGQKLSKSAGAAAVAPIWQPETLVSLKQFIANCLPVKPAFWEATTLPSMLPCL
jgi:glutamyl-tRNA synthetase